MYAVTLGGLSGRRDEAIELLDWLVAARADDQDNRLLALNDLTKLLQNSGNLVFAEQRLREALSGWERLRGQDDAHVQRVQSLGVVRPDSAAAGLVAGWNAAVPIGIALCVVGAVVVLALRRAEDAWNAASPAGSPHRAG